MERRLLATWPSPEYLRQYFRAHGRRLRPRTVAAYDASVHETIEVGTYFEYRDVDSNAPRVGYYHPESRRFVGLSDDELTILPHYRCPEHYVRDTLPGSTYV